MSKTARPATSKLRIGFIGTGGIAGTHLTELAKMSDVQIVALSDVSQAAVAKRAETFKVPAEGCFSDYKKMLAKVKPDAVVVCTPNGLHAPAAIAASKAGAHVLVEKPMAMNAQQAQAMIDAADKAGRKIAIAFQYRFHPRTRFLKQAADEGQFGKVLYTRVQALRRRGIPNWGVFVRKDLQGGGPMIDIGVHALEMAHFVMGSPKPVSAIGNCFTYLGDQPSDRIASQWKGWDYKHYTVEDLAVGQIRFANGAVLSIEASFAAHIEKNVWNFSVMGDKGGGTWDPPAIFRDEAGHMVNKNPGWLPDENWGQLFHAKIRNFIDHVLHGKPTIIDGQQGLMVQKMLDGIYASSAKGGKEVKIA